MVVVLILAAILLVFFILRATLNRIVRRASSKGWDSLLSGPTTDQTFLESFGIHNFTYAVAKALKPLRIDYMKFTSNLIYLA